MIQIVWNADRRCFEGLGPGPGLWEAIYLPVERYLGMAKPL